MAAALMMFLLLHSASAAAAQQRNSKISLGSSLTRTTNSAWFSASGTFAFGFYQLQPNNGYAVCIFLANLSERTVVWTAHYWDNQIVLNNPDLQLLINGTGLMLLQMESHEIYDIIASPGESTASASMLDNGNFVLYDSHGLVIWQSFDHPTDTLLPGQRLSPGAELFSRASASDLNKGIFRLKMQSDGNIVQYPADTPDEYRYAYYMSNTGGAVGDFDNDVSLNLENDGRLYLLNRGSVLHNLTRGGYPVAGRIYLMRIDVDGIFRLYYHSLDREGNLTSIWSPTENKCISKGLCGVNSYCTYLNQTADCKCLPGYDFVQPGNWTAGCGRNFAVQSCTNKDQSGRYEIRRIPNVNWDDNSYADLGITTEEDCGHACLDDCYCDAAFFNDGNCRKQRIPLKYGRWMLIYSNVALVKVNRPALETTGSSYNSGSTNGLSHPQMYVIIGASLGIAALVLSSIITYYVKYRLGDQGQENNHNIDKFLLNYGSLAPKRYSYREIKKITKSFTDKLGQGGYGTVYKGKLPDGQLVAVKVLTETNDNAEEFINEVASISRTSHVNIVNLLGFCYGRKKRALVYEFMPNKSLDKFIYKSGSVDQECSLEWKKLYEIAVGVARGLEYLHRGCNTRIVHFDIKPQNILLDEEFWPKISDFGLAKLFKKKQSIISMLGARGTIGYIAPEVFSRNFGAVSHKSDVYSYGMMLLEMAEARKIAESEVVQSSENYFPDKIYEHVLLNNENLGDLVIEEREEIKRQMLMVGLWCIQTAPSDRPSMTKVVEMLEGSLQSMQIPPKPFLYSPMLSGQKISSSFSVYVETGDSTKG